jgi:hypothetical protein
MRSRTDLEADGLSHLSAVRSTSNAAAIRCWCGLGAEFVVTAAHILDERVAFDDDARAAVPVANVFSTVSPAATASRGTGPDPDVEGAGGGGGSVPASHESCR